jgi:S1-C subfamily serine protease
MRLARIPRLVLPAVLAAGTFASLWLAAATPLQADGLDPRLKEAETKRVAVIGKLLPTVAAVFAPGGMGGGSGVVISKDGYALTNFHVVEGSGPLMQCGLSDGGLYDAVVVGTDKVGDIALLKLLPKKPGQEFAFAPLGDSDKLKPGDWSMAMGNPFLLATDFTPTVTFGLVSGVHRYQYPEGKGLLEYTDCIQVDTSINPGNSGGPLFNINGELIGINGRISLEKRGRVNCGVGYAISVNQIKNFMGHLRAGLDVDHASLGAFIDNKESGEGMIVSSIIEGCDANRRGLELNDELVSFAGRIITNRNHYQNILGIFPKGWRMPLVFRHENQKHEILVRLMGLQRHEIEDLQANQPGPRPNPQRPPQPKPNPNSPAMKLYQPKDGYANYYFNKLERDRLWHAFKTSGDFSGLTGTWTIEADLLREKGKSPVTVVLGEQKNPDGKTVQSIVRMQLPGGDVEVDPLKSGQDAESLQQPPDSGGFLLALYHYRRLLTLGEKGFERSFSHGGNEPFYPMPADGSQPKSLADLRVDTEVLRTEHSAIPVKWYFAQKDPKTLLGFELFTSEKDDPCEVYCSDYRPVDGRQLPFRMEIRYGNGTYGYFLVKKYKFAAAR